MEPFSFGFFGVQIAYALQRSSCEPNFPLSEPIPTTSVIFDSAPLMGLIVQPIVGLRATAP